MPSTFTPNKVYELQATGENPGTWGTLLDSVLSIIDLNLGGKTAIAGLTNVDVTLTTDQAKSIYITLAGALTGNVNILFPASKGGIYVIYNATTNAFTVTVKPSGGAGVVLPQGGFSTIIFDGAGNASTFASLPNAFTARGDLITRSATGIARLPIGAANLALTSSGTDPVWTTVSLSAGVTGTLPVANGGTGQITAVAAFNALSPLTTRGDLLTNDGTNDIRLAVGAANRYISSNGTDPSWAQVSLTAGVTGVLPIANGGTGQSTAVAAYNALSPLTTRGDLLTNDGTNDIRLAINAATSFVLGGGTDPTWRSISVVIDNFFGTVQGSTIYRDAANWGALGPSTAGLVLRTGGAAANPTWGQVSLTTAVSGVLPIANGGTGQATATLAFNALSPTTTRGDLIVRDSVGNDARLALGGANSIVASNGTDPVWRTMTVALDGGIGATQGQIIYRNATTWVPLVAGTAGQFLKTGGAAANPSWDDAVSTIITQVFTTPGAATYTPTAGMIFCIIECVGGGGGGGGGVATGSGSGISSGGGGGGGGGYSRSLATAATIGASKAVTVGAAGAGGTVAGTNGGNGSTSSVAAICTAGGGTGGVGSSGLVSTIFSGGSGGAAGTGNIIAMPGMPGGLIYSNNAGLTIGGGVSAPTNYGGNSHYGNGGAGTVTTSAVTGNPGTGYGGGGSGMANYNTALAAAGGAGSAGIVIITEFLRL